MVVRFKSIGSAPIMKNNVFKVTAGNKFQAVIVFLRSQLGLKVGDPLVCRLSLPVSPLSRRPIELSSGRLRGVGRFGCRSVSDARV